MTIDEFEQEDALLEISRKLSNVSIYKLPSSGGIVEKEALPTIKYLLFSKDRDQIKQSTRLLRRYLTQGLSDETSVNDILALDILPRLKELIESQSGNTIKFECAWIITNIAAGTTEQTNAVINAGFVDLLLNCLGKKESELELKAQAAWALGNIAGESPSYREELMKKGFTVAMVNVLNDAFDEAYHQAFSGSQATGCYDEVYFSDIESLLWSLSNMSRGGFCVAEFYQNYIPMFDVFSKYLVFDYTKLEIEVCWGLSRILYNMHEVNEFHQQNYISKDLCNRLSKLLAQGGPKVVIPAIRTIVNITSGPNHCIRGLLKSPLLSSMIRLLEPHAATEIRKDAYLILSNLAAGSEEMIRYVSTNRLVMLNVVEHTIIPGHTFHLETTQWIPTISSAYYQKTDEWKVTKEVLWIIFNIVSLGQDQTVFEFLQQYDSLPHRLAGIISFMDIPTDICEKTVECLISIVQRSNAWIGQRFLNGQNPYAQLLIEKNLSHILHRLQERFHGLKDLFRKLDTLLLASEQDVIKTVQLSSTPNAFGLPTIVEIKSKSSKRRVLRNFEDGDVRLIENAVGNLCI